MSGKPALKSQATAKYQLPGHEVVGTAAWNQDCLDSAANYTTVPMSMSLDLQSKDRPEGLQYRVGVHQVSLSQSVHTFIFASAHYSLWFALHWCAQLISSTLAATEIMRKSAIVASIMRRCS